MNTKFIVFTRGRTGSSAIIDELNNITSIIAAQELFIKMDFSAKKGHLIKDYPFVQPYYLWKLRNTVMSRLISRTLSEKQNVSRYLNSTEKKATKKGVKVFGFKVLSHHFAQTHGLESNLIQRKYQVIYLTRNIPRQIISGMIAKQRGKYNTKEAYHDKRRYEIDIEEFKKHILWGEKAVQNDVDLLKQDGFNFIVVTYEEYLNQRENFFENLLSFLNVPRETPPPSSFSIMIKDLEYTVANFQAVVDCLEEMKMDIQ